MVEIELNVRPRWGSFDRGSLNLQMRVLERPTVLTWTFCEHFEVQQMNCLVMWEDLCTSKHLMLATCWSGWWESIYLGDCCGRQVWTWLTWESAWLWLGSSNPEWSLGQRKRSTLESGDLLEWDLRKWKMKGILWETSEACVYLIAAPHICSAEWLWVTNLTCCHLCSVFQVVSVPFTKYL